MAAAAVAASNLGKAHPIFIKKTDSLRKSLSLFLGFDLVYGRIVADPR